MKKFKIIAVLFTLTCILSLNNIKADGYIGLMGVKIPAFQGTYESSSQKKTTYSYQYVYSLGAIDNLSGDDRGIEARPYNIGVKYEPVPQRVLTKLKAASSSGLGAIPGDYKLQMKATRWLASSATVSLTWYLDEQYINI